MSLARDLHERAFAWITLGDERNLVAAFVAGRERYRCGGMTTDGASSRAAAA